MKLEPLAPGLTDRMLRQFHRAGATTEGIAAAWGVPVERVRQRFAELGVGRMMPSRGSLSEAPAPPNLKVLRPMLIRLSPRKMAKTGARGLPARSTLAAARAELPRLRKRLAAVKAAREAVRRLPLAERKLVAPERMAMLEELRLELVGDTSYAANCIKALTVGHARGWDELATVTSFGYCLEGSRIDSLSPEELREGACVHRVESVHVGRLTAHGRRWLETLRQARRPRTGGTRRRGPARMAAAGR